MNEKQTNKYPGYNLEQQMIKLNIVRAICNDSSFGLQVKIDAVTQFIGIEKDILSKTKGLLRSRALDSASSLLRSLKAPMAMNFFLPLASDADQAAAPATPPTTTPPTTPTS